MHKSWMWLGVCIGVLFGGQTAYTKPALGKRMMRKRPRPAIAPGDAHFRTDFQILEAPPETTPHRKDSLASATGSSIAAIAGGALTIDEDNGQLSLLDADLKVVDRATIASGAGMLAVDREKKLVYVADRMNDQVQIYGYGAKLEKKSELSTEQEPYNVALSPSGETLYVLSVAGRKLQAFDASSGKQRFNIQVGPEARGLSVSPDGNEIAVSFLNTAALAKVDLSGSTPRLRFQAITDGRTPSERENTNISRHQAIPERHARAAFATTYIGETAVVAYQQSSPLSATKVREVRGTYGGSAEGNPPLMQRLAFMPRGWNSLGRAHVRMQMPRAMSYAPETGDLFIADLALDEIIRLEKSAMGDMQHGDRRFLRPVGKERCGPNGIAREASGDLLVYCSFERQVVRLDMKDNRLAGSTESWSKPLGTSTLSAAAQRGRALFHKGNDARLSSKGSLSCANCHPEGRNDGLSWSIEGKELQTPLLAGRMKGTHPFKWDGQDRDLETSLMHTVKRLGGHGIQLSDAKDLQAYLETMPAIVTPNREASKVAAGKRLFRSEELGCATCHSGRNFSDGKSYELSDDMPKVNTPSLIGLAASAPYYHDGSAATLRDLVLENGNIHGMGDMSRLNEEQVDHLVAYLETL